MSAVIQSLEIQLRDAAFRDLRQMLEELFNDRSILADDQAARPCEIIHRQRSRRVKTLFGPITLFRNYYYHTKAHQGRYPLDETLDLVRGDTPSLAKLICKASTLSASYACAGATLAEFAGVTLDERKFSRLVADIVPGLEAAQATLPKPSDTTLPILYLETDGTGTPFRREILAGVKGKQPDGSAHTREAKLGCAFKQSGMFRGETGGTAILKLRCMVLSGNFEEIWEAHLPILAQTRAQAPRWSISLN